MEIGKNIARLRKEHHLTQEQLGQAVGVSAQAISKWENGGAPDAELLPVIADCLNVTIDTLFGRESAKTTDIRAALYQWLSTPPPDKRLWELFVLLSQSFFSPFITEHQIVGEILGKTLPSHFPSKTCYSDDILPDSAGAIWLRACLKLSQGLQLGVLSEDCPMYLLMPEPEGGYASNFAPDSQYRKLFYALSLPGVLEILRYLYSKKNIYFSIDAIRKVVPLSLEEAETAIHAMEESNLISATEVELEDGAIPVYILHTSDAYVPFMMFARWISEEHDAFISRWEDRTAPILSPVQSNVLAAVLPDVSTDRPISGSSNSMTDGSADSSSSRPAGSSAGSSSSRPSDKEVSHE